MLIELNRYHFSIIICYVLLIVIVYIITLSYPFEVEPPVHHRSLHKTPQTPRLYYLG